VAPSPAGNTYAYNGIDSCPPSGGDLTTVLSYPCGTCIDYGSGTYGMYSCDSANVNSAYYMTPDCSGAPLYTYPVETVGCSSTSTQVTVTSCNMGAEKNTAGSLFKEPAAILAAREAARAIAQGAADLAKKLSTD
jgi:hypothetical protein